NFHSDVLESGYVQIYYTVSDDGTTRGAPDFQTATGLLRFAVQPVNDAPVAAADHLATDEDVPLLVALADLTGNDSDVDNAAADLTVVGVATANGGTALTVTIGPDVGE